MGKDDEVMPFSERPASSGRVELPKPNDPNLKCQSFRPALQDAKFRKIFKHFQVCELLHRVGQPVVLNFETFSQAKKEALACWAQPAEAQAAELQKCFEDFDPQKTGFLQRATIATIMGGTFSEEQLEELLSGTRLTSKGYKYSDLVEKLLNDDEKVTCSTSESSDGSCEERGVEASEGIKQSLEEALREEFATKLAELQEALEASNRQLEEAKKEHLQKVRSLQEKLEASKRETQELTHREDKQKVLMEEREERGQNQEIDRPRSLLDSGVAATQRFEEALQIFEESTAQHGADHPEIASAYQSLDNQKLDEATQILSFHLGAVLPLRFTVKERPSVLRNMEETTFLGRFKAGAKKCFVSYPGKFKGGWQILVRDDGEYSDQSAACVYCCKRKDGLGVHVPDPLNPAAPCYCWRICGKGNPTNRNFHTFGYLFEVGPPYDDEKHMKNAEETAKAMNAILVRKDASPEEYRKAVEDAKRAWSEHGERPAWGCFWYDVWYKNTEKGVKAGQTPVVVYYPGMLGMGKATMEDLSNPDVSLWDSDSSNRGLGGSQKMEVATMDAMNWPYEEMDFMEFIHRSLQIGEKVLAWNEGKRQWTRGVIASKRELEPQDKEDVSFKWAVQCQESEDCFETSRIRPDNGEMDELEEKLIRQDFIGALNVCLQEGQTVISTCPRKEWLQDGTPAMTFDIRSQDVGSLQKLCSDVLSGNFEVSINKETFKNQTETAGLNDEIDYWQLQVNKTEFVKAYKSMLMSSTRLTPHQQDRLSKLDESNRIHLKAAAGSGKTFVAAQKVVNTLLGHPEGQVLFVAPCKTLCLHFVRLLLMMDTGGRAEELVCARLKVMYNNPFKCFMTVRIVDNKRRITFQEEKNTAERELILAVVDEAHDIFCPRVVQKHLKETLQRSKQSILLSDLSQSSALEQNFHELGHYDEVYLTETVRSTERVALGAKSFQLSFEHEQSEKTEVTSIGSKGPPLKTFIFERPKKEAAPLFNDYCHYTIAALKHVVSSYPDLSLHHNVAIIVPHSDFLGKLKPLLKKKLQEEITCRKLSKRLGLISFEDSLSYLVSSSVAEQDSKEEHMILDSIDNAKGLEQLIVIVVGMDAEIKSKGPADLTTLAARAGLYQSITRAQLLAVVVNKLLPGGWLAHLATCRLKQGQFDEREARGEAQTTAATNLVQDIQSRKSKKNNQNETDKQLDSTGRSVSKNLPESQSSPSRGKSPAVSSLLKPVRYQGAFETSVWDTDQNSLFTSIAELRPAFNPLELSLPLFDLLKSKLSRVPLPSSCPFPEEDCFVCWQNFPDEVAEHDEFLERMRRLYLFHRGGAWLERTELISWDLKYPVHAGDPELHGHNGIRTATRYIREGRYALQSTSRKVTLTYDRLARAEYRAAGPGRGGRFEEWAIRPRVPPPADVDLEELSEKSKNPSVKPIAWPDHNLSEQTLKDLEEQWKERGPWSLEHLWFSTTDLG
ncbi:unnamed protein product [Durusdinium trenchii]|uniref:Helicase/UvrB N-terminal domain-containing protein n=1 Tax=Durusdinium trenchii TaxID=1381693 RepID=A0ABP0N8M3_9DINO